MDLICPAKLSKSQFHSGSRIELTDRITIKEVCLRRFIATSLPIDAAEDPEYWTD